LTYIFAANSIKTFVVRC